LHGTALTVGTVFLALGFLFYALEFQWIIQTDFLLPRSEVEAITTCAFFRLALETV